MAGPTPRQAHHPVYLWRSKAGFTFEQVSKMVIALGGQLAPRTCEAIEKGYRQPSWKLCKFLSLVSGNTFSPAELKDFDPASAQEAA